MYTTYLSTEIYNFIKLCGTEFDFTISNKYITTNLTVNWTEINSIFSECYNDHFMIHEQTDEWYRSKIKIIHEILCEASKNIKNASEGTISNLWERSSWADRTIDLQNCYQYFCSNEQTELLKCLLILTSIIERALGNVYKIENKNVPFLLKDLLETKYLFGLLGFGPIRLMQLLFGTSKALNIRNIAWHGFLSVNEINQNLIAILFILIASIGDILKIKNIEMQNIPFRPQITNLEQKINEIESRNTFINVFEYTDCLKKITENSNNLIGVTHMKFWEKIISHPVENCFNNCIILILPLFEQLLRKLFCKINSCDDRNLTAMQKEKYTTLDEIFAPKIGDDPNKLFEILNKGAVDFYEDLFSHLSGPRIRDKFSHGEIILQSVPCKITEILLNLILYCIIKINVVENTTFIEKFTTIFENYESMHHPNSILKYKILNGYIELNKLLDIPRPTDDEIEENEIEIEQFNFNHIIIGCTKKLNTNLNIFVENLRIPTLQRPNNELKLTKKLTKITEKIVDISEQIIADNQERYQSFIDKTLGSRQIYRYHEILKSISIVHNSLNCILHIVVLIMKWQFSQNTENFELNKHIFRFLQSTVNYEDKINRFSAVKINKWKKVRSLTVGYGKQLNGVYEKHLKNVNINDFS